MEALIKELELLAKQSRLIPAEVIVTRKLAMFESVLPTKLGDAVYESCENALLGLLFVNSGALSMQCSVRIANCLITLYKQSEKPKLWNLFTAVAKRPTVTGMFAIGHIIRQIGEHSKSMIPGLVKLLVNESDLVPALFALQACFKQAAADLKGYCEKVFAMCKRAIAGKEEVAQLLAVKMLEELFELDVIPAKRCEQTLRELLSANESTFVVDETCFLVAKWAFRSLVELHNRVQKSKEWQIGSKEDKVDTKVFLQAFDVLKAFKQHFSCVLQHFLDLMKPQFVFENLPILFKFVRETSPSDIYMLLSLFGRDVRSELFREISDEQPPSSSQQQLLRALAYDQATTKEIAALSLQLTSSTSPSARLSGASFFSQLAEKDMASAEGYLQMAVLYLAVPPEDNPTLEQDMHGMALIASHIIGACSKRTVLIKSVADNLKMFLARAVECTNIFSSEYTSVFMMLSVLPAEFLDVEKVEKCLSRYITYVESLSTRADVKHPQAKELTRYVISFLAAHPYVSCCEKILTLLAAIPCIQSQTTVLCALFAAAEACVVPKVYNSLLLPWLLAAQPSPQHMSRKLKAPMPLPYDMLYQTKSSVPKMDLIYFKVSKPYFAFRAIEFYPNVVLSLSNEEAVELLWRKLTGTTNLLMVHSLVLAVLQNVATQMYLPENLHKILLPTIDDDQTDVSRLQITCECIAIWCSLHTDAFADVIGFLKTRKGVGKCLCYNAFFPHISMSNELVILIVQELNGLIKVPLTCPYALFALSTMLKCYPTQTATMGICDMEMSVLLSAIHTRSLLSPYNLYNMSLVLQRLLPVVTPELNNENTKMGVRLIIGAFRQTRIPFAQQIAYHTYQTVFAFAKDFVNPSILVFPSSLGSSLSLKVAACGAFADMLKVFPKTETDYFDLIPNLLIVLQQMHDCRVTDFITQIASHFAAEENPKPERITAWVQIIKSVLSNGSLPNLQIESSMAVKAVCASVSNIILPVIAKTEPFLNECLDDLMTSATRAIENGIMESSYAFFCNVLKLFKGFKSENGLQLLELYDSQFSIGLRHGFTDMTYTGDFLFDYLRFHETNLRTQPENFLTVTNCYVKGITQCETRNDAFYAVASLICDIARTNKFIYERIEGSLPGLEKDFSLVVREAMATFYRDPPDYVQVSVFRVAKEKYYEHILVSYIWLHSLFSECIDAATILDFLNKELESSPEEWRVNAATEALAASFKYFSEDAIPSDVLKKTVQVVVEVNKKKPQLLRETLPLFLMIASERNLEPGSELWTMVFNLCLESCFESSTIARLIGKHPRPETCEQIAKKVFEVGQCDDKSLALLTIVMEHAWKTELQLLYTTPRFDNKFKLKLLTRIMKTTDSIAGDEQKIAELYFALFKRGGMNDLAQILIEKPLIAYAILSVDGFQRACEFCEKDVQNCAAFIQFLNLAVSQCQLTEQEYNRLMLTAMKCATNLGADPQKGREILETTFRLIIDINSRCDSLMRRAFSELNEREQQIIVQLLEKHVARTKVRQNALNLKQFSTRAPTRQRGMDSSDDEEWQALEIGD